MLKILVVSDRQARVDAQVQLAKELNRIDPSIQIGFVVDSPACYRAAHSGGFSVLELNTTLRRAASEVGSTKSRQNHGSAKSKPSLLKRFLKFVPRKLVLYSFIHFFLCYWRLWRTYRIASQIISEHKPNVIITNGDRGAYFEQAFLKAAKNAKVKTVLPYLVSSVSFSYRDLIVSRRGDAILEHDGRAVVPRFLRIFAKQNAIMADGRLYFFFDPGSALAYRVFGTLSPWPWQMGCGAIDVVCVDSRMTYELYRDHGVSEGKMAIIGDIAFDSLFRSFCGKEQVEAAVMEKYSKDTSKKTIVFALPQFAEHGLMAWENHWREIHYLVNHICSTGQNVLLSLHPRMDKKKYSHLEQQYPCRILEEPLREVLPIADLFIAFYSSTIIWAPMCLVKTALVDFWDFRLDYFQMDSIKLFTDKGLFEHNLDKYLYEPVDFSQDEERLSRTAIFDGNTSSRYVALLKSLLNKKAGENNG